MDRLVTKLAIDVVVGDVLWIEGLGRRTVTEKSENRRHRITFRFKEELLPWWYEEDEAFQKYMGV